LKRAGYSLLALDPAGEAIESVLLPAPAGKAAAPLALVLGTEGAGLSEELLDLVDRRLRIDMVAGADSLNVSTATGIALHYLFIGGTPDGANL
jgi:tRNA G18 (ribose-2'-O)-methylase SpoU